MSYGKGRWHCEVCPCKFGSMEELIAHEREHATQSD